MSYYCSALLAMFRVFHVVPYFSLFRRSAVPLFRVLVTSRLTNDILYIKLTIPLYRIWKQQRIN